MLTGPRLLRRPAFTLVELLVALGLTGIALLLLASIAVQQERALGSEMDALAGRAELRVTTAGIPQEIRALDPAAGDIKPGEARDTSLQFRGTIGVAIVCDTTSDGIVLAPATERGGFAGYLRVPAENDTLWTLDASRSWSAHVITATREVAGGTCGSGGGGGGGGGGPLLEGDQAGHDRIALRIADSTIVAPGTVARVTRPVRYSLYKSSDRLWYLGARDWNTTSRQFNTIQPISGPFLSAAAHGLVFTYLDGAGGPLATPVARTDSIAAVRMTLIAAKRMQLGPPSLFGATDTISVLVRLRGGAP